VLGSNVHIVSERIPLARWVLRMLRSRDTEVKSFRSAMRLAGLILALETSRELEWEPVEVETPLEVKTQEYELRSQPLLIGVLGASIYMLEGFQQVYEEAPVALIAAKRFEKPGGVEVKIYYERMPEKWLGPSIVVDPMLATGKTIDVVVTRAKKAGSSKVVVASIIASIPGLRYIAEKHPDVPVYTLTVDPGLNHKYFIVPGLGDAGDRALGVTA